MFDIPDAKRVRREDLSRSASPSSSPSPSPSPELAAAYRARLTSIYDPDSYISDYVPDDVQPSEGEGDEEYSFRLFAGEDPRHIVIREEELGEGAFLGEDPRGWRVERARGERRRGIESVAVSGEEVLRRGKGRAWGLEVSWRVLVVRGGVEKGGGFVKGGEGSGKRKRKGKRMRIAIRERVKRGVEERVKREKEEREREERGKDKRVRRNKEKKVKRKMKEKAEKAKKASGEGGTAEGSVTTDQLLSGD